MNSISLRASQIQLTYEDEGAGPVVVLLHAFPLDSTMWKQQRSELSDAFRIVTPSFPGFGGSSLLQGLTIDAGADVIAELLDHLGINERVVVGGVSMGGYVALAFARLYPQRLRALILSDTKADGDDQAAKTARDRTIEQLSTQGASDVIEQLLPKLVGTTTQARRKDVVESVRAIAQRQPAESMAIALRALRDRPDATPALSHVSVPTITLVGAEDTITPPEKARALADAIPNARLEIIPDAGHLSNLESPEKFNAIVRQFLAALPEDTRSSRTV